MFSRKLSAGLKAIKSKFNNNEECNVLLVGLDNSGKSTIVEYLKKNGAGPTEVAPTVGFRVEKFVAHNFNFTVFDMSGQGEYRNLWEKYYDSVQAIIFVLDAADELRLCIAKDELEMVMEHDCVKDQVMPILFFANKMDLPNALNPVDCMKELDLQRISDKPWQIAASNAKTGQGVAAGIEWLSERIAPSRAAHKGHK